MNLSLDAYKSYRVSSSGSLKLIVREGEYSSTSANKMKITCVLAIIMSFLAWETAGFACFGKHKYDCIKTDGCTWKTVWTYIGYCHKDADADAIQARGQQFGTPF